MWCTWVVDSFIHSGEINGVYTYVKASTLRACCTVMYHIYRVYWPGQHASIGVYTGYSINELEYVTEWEYSCEASCIGELVNLHRTYNNLVA